MTSLRPLFAASLALAFAACDAAPAPSPAANSPAKPSADSPAPAMDVYSLKLTALDGKPVDMSSYRGKVTLLVNVASECGYTPQYAGLQKLHAELKDRGFAVLGFPSNEFGGQEPGSAEQIRDFCAKNYQVDFPMFAKLETKAGAGQSPLYGMLGSATGKLPTWNFCKYLVGKDGKPVQFYASNVKPESAELRTAIETAMK